MAASYTFDVFSTIDGFGAPSGGDWGAYWGKQGPELLAHREAVYAQEQRLVIGRHTFDLFGMLAGSPEAREHLDPWAVRMLELPLTVISSTLSGDVGRPGVTLVNGDAVEAVARLKELSDVPLRSHGSLSLNRTLMGAGLVDRVQVTLFPVITGQHGDDPVFAGAADFDLELLEQRTLDGNTLELTYRPTVH